MTKREVLTSFLYPLRIVRITPEDFRYHLGRRIGEHTRPLEKAKTTIGKYMTERAMGLNVAPQEKDYQDAVRQWRAQLAQLSVIAAQVLPLARIYQPAPGKKGEMDAGEKLLATIFMTAGLSAVEAVNVVKGQADKLPPYTPEGPRVSAGEKLERLRTSESEE